MTEKKNKIILAVVIVVAIIIVGALLFFINRQNEATELGSHLISGFTVPDQSTPERTLRTFWWAIINGEDNIALACVDREKVDEGCHDCWNYSSFISEFSQLDTSDFRFLAGETRVSIESSNHFMDYDMEKQDEKWVIISIHP